MPSAARLPSASSFAAPTCDEMGIDGGFGASARGALTLHREPGAPAPACTVGQQESYLAPSSSGPGRRPLKAVARVQIPSGLHE
jgi:hypothetical protein